MGDRLPAGMLLVSCLLLLLLAAAEGASPCFICQTIVKRHMEMQLELQPVTTAAVRKVHIDTASEVCSTAEHKDRRACQEIASVLDSSCPLYRMGCSHGGVTYPVGRCPPSIVCSRCTMYGSHFCSKVNEDGSNGEHDLSGRNAEPKPRTTDLPTTSGRKCLQAGTKWCPATGRCETKCGRVDPNIVATESIVLPSAKKAKVLNKVAIPKTAAQKLAEVQADHEKEAMSQTGSPAKAHATMSDAEDEREVTTEKESVVAEIREAHAMANLKKQQQNAEVRKAQKALQAETAAKQRLANKAAEDAAAESRKLEAGLKRDAAAEAERKAERKAVIREQNLALLGVVIYNNKAALERLNGEILALTKKIDVKRAAQKMAVDYMSYEKAHLIHESALNVIKEKDQLLEQKRVIQDKLDWANWQVKWCADSPCDTELIAHRQKDAADAALGKTTHDEDALSQSSRDPLTQMVEVAIKNISATAPAIVASQNQRQQALFAGDTAAAKAATDESVMLAKLQHQWRARVSDMMGQIMPHEQGRVNTLMVKIIKQAGEQAKAKNAATTAAENNDRGALFEAKRRAMDAMASKNLAVDSIMTIVSSHPPLTAKALKAIKAQSGPWPLVTTLRPSDIYHSKERHPPEMMKMAKHNLYGLPYFGDERDATSLKAALAAQTADADKELVGAVQSNTTVSSSSSSSSSSNSRAQTGALNIRELVMGAIEAAKTQRPKPKPVASVPAKVQASLQSLKVTIADADEGASVKLLPAFDPGVRKYVAIVTGDVSDLVVSGETVSNALKVAAKVVKNEKAAESSQSDGSNTAMVSLTTESSTKVAVTVSDGTKGNTATYFVLLPQLCPSGKQLDTSSGLKCEDCPAGKFKDTTGTSACTPCPKNTFTGAPGSVKCTPCLANTTTLQSGADECLCMDGFRPYEPTPSIIKVESSSLATRCVSIDYCDTDESLTANCSANAVCESSGPEKPPRCTCAAGFGGNGKMCKQCRRGSFKSHIGNRACDQCSPGLSTLEKGAVPKTQCRDVSNAFLSTVRMVTYVQDGNETEPRTVRLSPAFRKRTFAYRAIFTEAAKKGPPPATITFEPVSEAAAAKVTIERSGGDENATQSIPEGGQSMKFLLPDEKARLEAVKKRNEQTSSEETSDDDISAEEDPFVIIRVTAEDNVTVKVYKIVLPSSEKGNSTPVGELQPETGANMNDQSQTVEEDDDLPEKGDDSGPTDAEKAERAAQKAAALKANNVSAEAEASGSSGESESGVMVSAGKKVQPTTTEGPKESRPGMGDAIVDKSNVPPSADGSCAEFPPHTFSLPRPANDMRGCNFENCRDRCCCCSSCINPCSKFPTKESARLECRACNAETSRCNAKFFSATE